MSCKKWRLAASCVEVAGALLLLIAFVVKRGWNPLSVLGLALMLAGLVVQFVKFRCPVCKRYISDRVPLDITRCPYCGAELEPHKGASGRKH